jgi:hypothetical protein
MQKQLDLMRFISYNDNMSFCIFLRKKVLRMMRRMLSVVLVLALAFGALAVTASAADPNAVDYRVGYAKVDANPYWSVWKATGGTIPTHLGNYATDMNGKAIGPYHIMPLPMGGYGGNVHRLSRPELVDDNGSGKHAGGVVYLTDNRPVELGGQNDGDGIWTTCVSIRQNPTAEPVLMLSVDLIGMSDLYCGRAKNVIIRELKKIGVSITPDRILINATHTHGAVSLSESFDEDTTYKLKLWGNSKTVSFRGSDLNAYLSAYRKHLYAQMAAAAVQAIADGQNNGTVTMSKGTIDVSKATGYTLNGVRHSKAQLTTTVDGVSQKVDYVTGSSFNVNLKGGKEVEAVSDSNDLMHVIQFSFPDASVKPILMVNWRAHTTWNNKMGTHAHNSLSADFVAAMRYKLEQWGYRFLLNYGASGNLGTGTTPSTYNIGTSTSSFTTKMPGTDYGFTLAYAAAYLVSGTQNSSVSSFRTSLLSTLQSKFGTSYSNQVKSYASPGMTVCAQGEILLETTYYDIAPQNSSEAGYQAALYHNAKAVDEGGSASKDGGLKLEKSGYPFLVKAGTYTANGQTFTVSGDFVIASQYHANSLKTFYGVLNAKRISLCAFTLGEQVAFVTVPFEASDRYSMSATLATANHYNDWDNLINNEKWGAPIVMSLTNGSEGYIPNNLAYTYTRDLEAKYIAGNCAQAFVSGSYEAHTAYAAAGQGEVIVAQLNTLLRGLGDTKAPEGKLGYCQACQALKTWTPLNDKVIEDNGTALATGHYYLAEDITTIYGQVYAYQDEMVCLDLNGHTYYASTNIGASRAFWVYGTLNVQDSVGTGVLKGKKAGGNVGGTVYVDRYGVLNLYSGKLTCDTTGTGTVQDGGVVYIPAGGTFNMYGGTVSGGRASRYGGNVQIQDGTMNMYGGTLTGGSASAGKNLLLSATGTFRFVNGSIASGASTTHLMGKVILGSDSFTVKNPTASTLALKNYCTVELDGVFTGKVTLNYSGVKNDKAPAYPKKPTTGDVIGTVTAGSAIDYRVAKISVTSAPSGTEAMVDGTNLIVGKKTVASVAGVEYTDIASALEASSQDAPMKLLRSYTSRVTLTKDVYIDLNGCSLSSVTANDYTLYCMDSKTDDYSVADGQFGTVPASNSVQVMDGYLAYTENKKTSFHKYDMAVTDLVVNTKMAGLAYKASFLGDEKVRDMVQEFGVAMNIGQAPDADSIGMDTENTTRIVLTKASWQTGAANGVKSVYVRNILTADGDAAANQYRADLQIYGACYIKLTDGTLLLGKAENRSLHSALKDMNDYFGNLSADDQKALKAFCTAWSDVMKDWTDIGNLK